MPIYQKSEVARFLHDLDKYHQALKATLTAAPNADVFNFYSHNPDDFARDFVEIDLDELHKAIEFHKVIVQSLKRLEKRPAKQLHKGR
ncbi:hypothetical protein VSS37_03880 [Candidatus Thiothrix sp. Deng01]|uniref:Uncharacterized protein n=1 Tax=Candidatus Thiothrix phosphatis TaxID=3112415 RepID=A0ABU6CTE6_9GAMM|nr:hypothetical protein [Candidatus Thiothrix sp. Deng01]MEB4590111.1 hypothetical protein [Candidatus Thiothrix sp. Deng01]